MSERTTEVQRWLAANVRRQRLRRGWTQEQLAELAGLELRHFQRIEQGAANVTLGTLVALADRLDVPPGLLLRRANMAPIRRGRPPARGVRLARAAR